MQISVIDPIGRAFERMSLVLFKPFDFSKWLILGFCAFLAGLGEGGGGGGMGNATNVFDSNKKSGSGGAFGGVVDWLSENFLLVVFIALGALLLFAAINLLVQWLSSRGKFMFLEGVVRNRATVSESWRSNAALGNSLFLFRFFLFVLGFAVTIVILLLCALVALPDLRGNDFGGGAILAILLLFVLLLPTVLIFAVVNFFLNEFVVPIMWLRNLYVMDAIAVFRREFLAPRLGALALFALLWFGLTLASGSIVFLVTCVTCCIAGLPYVSAVVFLPLTVFFRSYSLCFIEQFGPEWRFFDRPENPTDPQAYAQAPDGIEDLERRSQGGNS
jgi:hypothetical protein